MNRGYQNLKALEGATVNAVNTLAQAIAAERTYVDAEGRKLRDQVQAFTGRGLWSRLNWLVTGR